MAKDLHNLGFCVEGWSRTKKNIEGIVKQLTEKKFIVKSQINEENTIDSGATLLIFSADQESIIGIDSIFDKKDNFNYKKINTEAFGKNSIFSYLIKKNYKIICFCCSSNNITFLHYLEYLFEVPYRYIKKFKGTVVYNNFKSQISYKYNVGRKSCDYSFKENAINKLINQKNFIKSYFGKFECYSVTSKYLYNNLKKKINLNKKFLILQ